MENMHTNLMGLKVCYNDTVLQKCLPTPFKRETFAAKSSTIRLFSVSNISSVEVVLEPAQHAR